MEMEISKRLIIITFFFCVQLWGAPFIDNGNGTVTDSSTGLIWQKCSRGLGVLIGDCSTGSISSTNYTNAILYCGTLTLGGRSDWRLPNVNELGSLIDYTKSTSPLIDNIFPNTVDSYWSSTTYTSQGQNFAAGIQFSDGITYPVAKSFSINVRCVTGP